MNPFAKVLCATDLSEAADAALVAGDREARLHGAALTVVHVLPGWVSPAAMSAPGVEQTLVERERIASRAIDEILDRLERLTGRQAGDVAVVIDDGAPEVAILRQALAVSADLVVVGSTGATGLRRLIL